MKTRWPWWKFLLVATGAGIVIVILLEAPKFGTLKYFGVRPE